MSENVKIEASWKKALDAEFGQGYFSALTEFVKNEYKTTKVYPAPAQIFRAFDECPFDQVKVVIVGQDPYHGPGQAHGLCFSVSDGVKLPPSLQNIFKEIASDIGTPVPKSGDLTRWAKQGVLLLNATLTVRASQAGSHQGKGWEKFTDAAIKAISDQREQVVFLLWGRYAQQKEVLIDASKHLILKTVHPSPLSAYAGWFGSKHFSKANDYLCAHGMVPVQW